MSDDNHFDPWSPPPPKKKPKGNQPPQNIPNTGKPDPEMEDMLKKFRDSTKAMFGKKADKKPLLPLLTMFLSLWLLFGSVFFVGANEKAVVLRMGKYNRDAKPGINFKLPPPFEKEYPQCCGISDGKATEPSPDRV